MSEPEQSMITRWACTLPERLIINEFWDWLMVEGYASTMIGEIMIDKKLDAYHEIDQRQLDDERRALLEQCGRLNETSQHVHTPLYTQHETHPKSKRSAS